MSDFHTQYRKWLGDALEEYNEARKHSVVCGPRLYHQESVPEDYDPGDLVEFAENGDAYPHGLGGTNHIRKVVTPWEQSEHYTT